MTLNQFHRQLGTYIRQKRLQKKWTVSGLAERAELSKSMISQVENAKHSLSLDSLMSLAQVLGLDFGEILNGQFPKRCPRCKGTGHL